MFFAAGSLTLLWLLAVTGLAAVIILARKAPTPPTTDGTRMRTITTSVGVVVALMLIVAAVDAWRYERAVAPITHRPDTLAVMGDSLAADFLGDPTWPEQLADTLDKSLINHAHPGHRLQDGLRALDTQPIENALVIVLLGGNDILAPETRLADYTAQLHQLLQSLTHKGNTVVLVELPAPPTAPWYGWVQRPIASHHGVHLIPRRMLARILFRDPGHTTDGIHLSQQGHDRLAADLHNYLRLAGIRPTGSRSLR